MSDSGFIATGNAVPVVALVSAKYSIKLEKLGMKNSRGSITAYYRKLFGMSRRAPHDKVIAELQKRIDAASEKIKPGDMRTL